MGAKISSNSGIESLPLADFEAALRGDLGGTPQNEAQLEVKQMEATLRGGSRGDLHEKQQQMQSLDTVLLLASQWENKLFLGSDKLKLIELLLTLIHQDIEGGSDHTTQAENKLENKQEAYAHPTSNFPSTSPLLESFEVQIFSASGLAKADGIFGLSDPYTVVKWNEMDKEVGRTPVISKTLNPEWTDKNKFIISYPINMNPSRSVLVCEIWDHDFIGKHDFLGGIEVSSRFLKDWLLEAQSLSSGHLERGSNGELSLAGSASQPSTPRHNTTFSPASAYSSALSDGVPCALRIIDLSKVRHLSADEQQLVQGNVRIGIRPVINREGVSVSDKALDILNSLSLRSDNAYRMGTVGVIEQLVAICRRKRGYADVVRDLHIVNCKTKALEILKKLSLNDDNDSRMQSEDLGLVELLVDLLRNKDDALAYYGQVHALGIFRNISLDSDFKRSIKEDPLGLIDLLVQISNQPDFAPALSDGSMTERYILQVHRAKGLARADFEPFGLSDPFVIATWNGAEIGRTPHISRNLNPIWKDQVFSITYPLASDDVDIEKFKLIFEVWDYDMLGGGDFLGGYVVTGRDLLAWLETAKTGVDAVSRDLKLRRVDHIDIKEQDLVQGHLLVDIKHLFDESALFNPALAREDKLDARLNALYTILNLSGDIFHQGAGSPINLPVKGAYTGKGKLKLKQGFAAAKQFQHDLVQKLGAEKYGVVEMCMHAVKVDRTEARNIAFNILKFLSRNSQNSIRLSSEPLQLVERLLTILKKEKSTESRSIALSILLNLSTRSIGRDRLSDENLHLHTVLMAILKEEKQTSDLFKVSLAIFKNLSYNADQQVLFGLGIGDVSSGEDGTIASLCMALIKGEVEGPNAGRTISNPTVLMDVLKLVNNISLHKSNELRLANPNLGLVDLLMKLANNHQGEFRIKSISILWNLVTNSENQVRMAAESVGLVEFLVSILRDDSGGARIKALGALRVLSSRKANLIRLGSSEVGLVEALVSVIKESVLSGGADDYEDFVSIASSLVAFKDTSNDVHNNSIVLCLSVMQNLSSINANKSRMGSETLALIELLTEFISGHKHQPADTLFRALTVLWNLSLNIDNKIRMASDDLRLVESLVRHFQICRSSPFTMVDDMAMSLLWNISGSESMILLMQLHEKQLYESDPVDADGSSKEQEPLDFLELLSRLAIGESVPSRKVALRTLWHIARFGDSGLREDLGAGKAGVLPILRTALQTALVNTDASEGARGEDNRLQDDGGDHDSAEVVAIVLDIIKFLAEVAENKIRVVERGLGLLEVLLTLVVKCNMEARMKILNIIYTLISNQPVLLELSSSKAYCVSILNSISALVNAANDSFDVKRKAIRLLLVLCTNDSIQSHLLSEVWLVDWLMDVCISSNPGRKSGWQWAAARTKMLKVVAHAQLSHLQSSEKIKPGDLALFIIELLEKTPYDSINFEKAEAQAAVDEAMLGSKKVPEKVPKNTITSPRGQAGTMIYDECMYMLFNLLVHADGGANVVNEAKFSKRSSKLGTKSLGMVDYLIALIKKHYSPPDSDDEMNKESSRPASGTNRSLTPSDRPPSSTYRPTSARPSSARPISASAVSTASDSGKKFDIGSVAGELIGPLHVMSHLSTNRDNQDLLGGNLNTVTLLVKLLALCQSTSRESLRLVNPVNKRTVLTLKSMILAIFVNLAEMEKNRRFLGSHHLGFIEVLISLSKDATSSISDNDESVESRLKILSIILYLSESYEVRTRMSLKALGLIEHLQFITTEPKSESRDKANDTLKNLMELKLGTSTGGQQGFVDPDLIDSLVESLKQRKTPSAMKMKNLSTLADLSEILSTKQILMSENMKFLELSLDLSREQFGYKIKCLTILRNISSSSDAAATTATTYSNKSRLGSEKLGLIKLLMDTIAEHADTCRFICLEIIHSASENNALDVSTGYDNRNLVYFASEGLKLAPLLMRIVSVDRTSDEGILCLKILRNLATVEANLSRLGSESFGYMELLVEIVREGVPTMEAGAASLSDVPIPIPISNLNPDSNYHANLDPDSNPKANSHDAEAEAQSLPLRIPPSVADRAEARIKALETLVFLSQNQANQVRLASESLGLLELLVVMIREENTRDVARTYSLAILLKMSSNKLNGKRLNVDSLEFVQLLLQSAVKEVEDGAANHWRVRYLEILQNLIMLRETRSYIESKGDELIDFLVVSIGSILNEGINSPLVVLKCIFIFHQLCVNEAYKVKFGAGGIIGGAGLIELLLTIVKQQSDEKNDNRGRKQALALLTMLVHPDEAKLRVVMNKKLKFVETLLEVARENSSDPETRASVLDIFYEASAHVDLKIRLAIKALGLVDFVLDNLGNMDTYGYDSFLKSLSIVWNLSGNADNKVTMGDSNISPVVPMMKSVITGALKDPSGERVTQDCNRFALGVLLNLSTEEENKVSIGDQEIGIVEDLVATVEEKKGETRLKAIGVLQNLSVSSFNKIRMGSPIVGIPEVLTSILKAEVADTNACFKALGTLHNLSLHEVNEVRLAQANLGLVERLISLAKTDKGDFRVKSLGILWNLAANSENQVRLASAELGLVEVLMVIITEDKSEARMKALGVLRNLSINIDNKEYMGSLELGLVQLLMSLCSDHEDDAESFEDSLYIIQNLSVSHVNRLLFCKNLELVPLLIKIGKSSNAAGVDFTVINTLWNLTASDGNKVALGSREVGLIEVLVEFVWDMKDLKLADKALNVVNNLLLMNDKDDMFNDALTANLNRFGSNDMKLIEGLFRLLPASRKITPDDPRYMGQKYITVNVTKAICCLSVTEANQMQMAGKHFVDLLLPIVKADFSESRYFVLSTLQNLAQHPINQEIMGREDCDVVKVLINVSKESSINGVAIALGALGNLSLNKNNAITMAFPTTGLVPNLISIIRANRTNELRLKALCCLVNLTANDENQSYIGRDSSFQGDGLVELLLDIIRQPDDPASRLKALGILKNISLDPFKWVRLASTELVAMELLIATAHDDASWEARDLCFSFFQNVYALPENHARFTNLGLNFLDLLCHLELMYARLTSRKSKTAVDGTEIHKRDVQAYGASDISHLRKCIALIHGFLSDFYDAILSLPPSKEEKNASDSDASLLHDVALSSGDDEVHNPSSNSIPDPSTNQESRSVGGDAGASFSPRVADDDDNNNSIATTVPETLITSQNLSKPTIPTSDFLETLRTIVAKDRGTTRGRYRLRALKMILSVSVSNDFDIRARLGSDRFGFIHLVKTDVLERNWPSLVDSSLVALQILWNISGNKDGKVILDKDVLASIAFMGQTLADLLMRIVEECDKNPSVSGNDGVGAEEHMHVSGVGGGVGEEDGRPASPGVLNYLDGIVGRLLGIAPKLKMRSSALRVMWFLSRNESIEVLFGTKELGLVEQMMRIIATVDKASEDSIICMKILHNVATAEANQLRLGGDSLGLIELLVEVVRGDAENSRRLPALGALSVISHCPENLPRMGSSSLGLVELLFSVVLEGNSLSRVASLNILWNLSRHEANYDRLLLNVDNISNNDDEELEEDAAVEVMEPIAGCTCDYLKLLVSLLREFDTRIHFNVLVTLLTLSQEANIARMGSEELHLIELLMEVMKFDKKSENCVLALKILMSLATDPMHQLRMTRESLGLLEVLLEITISDMSGYKIGVVKSDHIEIAELALKVIEAIAQNLTVQLRLTLEGLGLLTLYKKIVLEDRSDSCIIVLRTLNTLAVNSTVNKIRMTSDDLGLIENCVEALKDNSGGVRYYVFILLATLADKTNSIATRMLHPDIGMLQVIATELNACSPDVRGKGMALLINLSRLMLPPNKRPPLSMALFYDLVDLLVKVVKTEQVASARRDAAEVLYNLSRLPTAYKIGLGDEVSAVFELFVYILTLTDETVDAALRSLCLQTMKSLSTADENKLRMLKIDMIDYDVAEQSELSIERVDDGPTSKSIGNPAGKSTTKGNGQKQKQLNVVASDSNSKDEDRLLDVLKGIVARKEKPDESILALGILQNLSVNVLNKPRMGSPIVGIPEVLTSILKAEVADTNACFKALGTLHNISLHEVNEVRLAQANLGLVERLISLAKTDKGDFRVKSLGILWNLAANSENQVRLASAELGLVEVLMVIITEDKSEARMKALGVLRNLSINIDNKEYMGSLELGLVELLMSLVVSNEGIFEIFFMILQNLSLSMTNKARMASSDLGLLDLIFSLLKARLPLTQMTDVHLRALSLLYSISVCPNSRQLIIVAAVQGRFNLVKYLTDLSKQSLSLAASGIYHTHSSVVGAFLKGMKELAVGGAAVDESAEEKI